ncbi:MAG: hypothetical protein EG828_04380 [Deltaproteobacteria bacterium]|nr:hypothetical protein [Deltaproteobacteria bacterium]
MKKSAILLIILLCLLPLGCQKKEGPAERLGKEIDKSADEAGAKFKDAVSRTGEKLGKATDDLKKSVDSFGSRIKKETGSTGREMEDSDKRETDTEEH